jgi:hypothetical protein
MNYDSLKRLTKLKRMLILGGLLLSSYSGLSNTLVVNATEELYDDEIITVNINESSNKVVSDMTSKSNTLGVDLQNVSLSTAGFSISEMLIKPKPVILDSNIVPDGEGVCNSANKTYMPYTLVTSKSSAQYKFLYSDACYTDPETGLRMSEGRYCIAVGTFYASKIGTKINLIMKNGSTVECILGDVKADIHTDETNRFQAVDGSVVEMIVDYNYFHSTSQYPEELNGGILRIEVVE